MHYLRQSPGFTLIELLVVVTIIVVLLALLTPALDKAIAQAERVSCGAQLHGQDLAMKQYALDFGKKYPSPVRDGHWPDGGMIATGDNAIVARTEPGQPAGQVRLFVSGYATDPSLFYDPGKPEGTMATEDSYWNADDPAYGNDRYYSTYVGYPYFAGGFRASTSDPDGTILPFIAPGLRFSGSRVVLTDAISVDVGVDFPNNMSRSHEGDGDNRSVTVPDKRRGGTITVVNPPAGGNVLTNDGATTWRDFEDASLRMPHPIDLSYERDFYF